MGSNVNIQFSDVSGSAAAMHQKCLICDKPVSQQRARTSKTGLKRKFLCDCFVRCLLVYCRKFDVFFSVLLLVSERDSVDITFSILLLISLLPLLTANTMNMSRSLQAIGFDKEMETPTPAAQASLFNRLTSPSTAKLERIKVQSELAIVRSSIDPLPDISVSVVL